MITLSLATIAEATGGELVDIGDADPRSIEVQGPVVADSREACQGALFVALRGERVDGHEFAATAVGAGAVAVLADRRCGVPAVVTDDVTAALASLARYVHDSLPQTTTVGVTGSSGKTSTKDLIASVLGRCGSTVAPPESYNNEIGHPLTVLRAEDTTRYLVLELSARGLGHIAHLAEIAPPQVGVVLNVGTAHLGEFGSQEGIAQAKGELVEALPAGGVAVLNADDPRVAGMAARTRARVVTFGRSGHARVRAEEVHKDDHGRPAFMLHAPAGVASVQLRLYGEHQVANALAAAAVATELGMPVPEVAAALNDAVPASRWRMDVRDTADGVTVINDAYNANPESMEAALRALGAIAGRRRTWAVLGEMAELGEATDTAHRDIGTLLVRLGTTRTLAVGTGAEPIVAGARDAGAADGTVTQVPDAASALALLRQELSPDDVVLVKASRAVGLEGVAAALHDESGEGLVSA